MHISNKNSTIFPIEAKEIPIQSEEIINLHLVPRSKLDFKTKEEKQQILITLAEDTRHRLKRSAMDIYCIGLNLLEAQNIIEHGEFLPWLRKEFGMGKTSAYEFINVAKAFESKIPIIGNLISNITPTALYKLASASNSEAAIDEAIDIIKAGKIVDPAVAKNLIKKYKTPKTVKIQQPKASSVNQQRNTSEVETLALYNTDIGQIEKTTTNSMSLSSTSQQDELQKLVTERDGYKAQLEALQMENEQLKLVIAKLNSELILLQTSNNVETS